MKYAINPVDGTKIAYRTKGAGPAVVLVHGTALSRVIWRGFGYVKDLSADHTVITLDLRGHGRSGKPQDQASYSTRLMAGDVIAVLDDLGISSAHYVGYSLGGRVGFSLATTHQDRLKSFVSMGGAPRNLPGAFDRLFFPNCIDALENDGMQGFVEKWEAHIGQPLDPATRAAFLANDSGALAAYARSADQNPGVATEALSAIEVPTLLVVGERDNERLDSAQTASRVIPNAELRILEGAGHGNTLIHPEALPVVREFITKRS
ncbi:alpha/beta hydrolase [Jonesiaceae bacterium BS-20]|uniref:Alpha/beta hydrolase n=1 Tax=Jonesiaceae bacterium BS-20 TaxID=3120821 RepID=A0AAU7DRL1_9MICO